MDRTNTNASRCSVYKDGNWGGHPSYSDTQYTDDQGGAVDACFTNGEDSASTIELAVNDGTVNFNTAFWAERCKQVPTTAPFVVVIMGTVVDYFKPNQGASWCDMLTSDKDHQWSKDAVTWETPAYLGAAVQNGGSAVDWPKKHVEGDARFRLSMWGVENPNDKGGCCSTSYTDPTNSWAHPFSIAYGIPGICNKAQPSFARLCACSSKVATASAPEPEIGAGK
jgi:hypothetical protein